MNESQSSNILDGISMITDKQRQFIKSTLANTDKALNQLRGKDSDIGSRSRLATRSQGKKQQSERISLNAIDKHYTLLLKCIEIKLNRPYNIFLQPHTQDYFTFDMGMHIFPLILHINKICAQGILFIGFNQEYPGIQRSSRNKDPLAQKKIPLNKVQNIQIQKTGNRNIHNLYFLFTSSKKCLTINFHLTSIISQSQLQITQKPKKNFFDIIDQKLKAPAKKFRVKTELAPKFSMTKASYLQKLQRISTDQHFSTFTTKFSVLSDKRFLGQDISELKKVTKSILFNESTSIQSLTKESFGLNKTLSKTQYKNQSITSFLRTHVNFSIEQKHQISQKNIQQLQLYKQKTDKLSQLVEKSKTQIKMMKKQHDQNQIKQKKILKSIATMVKLCQFSLISQRAFIKRKNMIFKFLKTVVNVNKFIKKLKSCKVASEKLVSSKNTRVVYGLLPLTQFLSATIWEKSDDSAQKALSKTFSKLFCSFLSRQMIQKSEIYMKKVLKIQRMYTERLKTQRSMLQVYCFKIAGKIIQKFPHMTKFENGFKEQKVYEKLISTYLKDENLKFNERVINYKRQIKQRDEFIVIKLNMIKRQKNESPSKMKRRSPAKNYKKTDQTQLQIPALPVRPCKALFRNLNILQTMIRNWFELQNFMWKKKEKAKLEWL